jgi:hypothetical protein
MARQILVVVAVAWASLLVMGQRANAQYGVYSRSGVVITPGYRTVYRAPVYRAPVYRAPIYSVPTYRVPVQVYRPPVYRYAPAPITRGISIGIGLGAPVYGRSYGYGYGPGFGYGPSFGVGGYAF